MWLHIKQLSGAKALAWMTACPPFPHCLSKAPRPSPIVLLGLTVDMGGRKRNSPEVKTSTSQYEIF